MLSDIDIYAIFRQPVWRDSQKVRLSNSWIKNVNSQTYSSYLLSRVKRNDTGSFYCFLKDKPDIFLQIDLIVQSKII